MSKELYLLEDLAESLAELKHYGQCYGTHPYTYHLREVVSLCSSPEARIVAWLHDILEDTDASYELLYHMFGKEIADAVHKISKYPHKTYEDYIKGVKSNGLSHIVKIADTRCNLWQSESEGDERRITKYTKQLELLLND